MKTTDFLNESFVEDAAAAQQDHEVQMARADCYNAAKYAIELHKLLKNISEQEGLDGWVSEKITLANDYLRTVTEYLRYEQQSPSSGMPEFDVRSATQTLDTALGESVVQEGTFTWYLKAHGRLLGPSTSETPYTFKSREEALAFAKQKYKTNWQNITATADTTANYLEKQPDAGWDEKRLNVREEDDEEKSKRKPAVVKTNKEIGTRVADIGPGGKEYNVKTNKAWDDQNKQEPGVEEGLGKNIKRAAQGWGGAQDKPANIVKRNKGYDDATAKKVRAALDDAPEHTPAGLQKRVLDRKLKGVAEGKADPTGSWVVYDGSKVKRFKTREGAKAYAEKNGGKVASSEHYADKIQKQGVAEGSTWYAGNGAIKEKIAKYEELALAANRAGDDAKTKMYQQKIQTLKQKMSHMEESAGGMGAASVATSMGGGNGFVNGGPGTISRPKMKKKK